MAYLVPVSYTHLDVYKRQGVHRSGTRIGSDSRSQYRPRKSEGRHVLVAQAQTRGIRRAQVDEHDGMGRPVPHDGDVSATDTHQSRSTQPPARLTTDGGRPGARVDPEVSAWRCSTRPAFLTPDPELGAGRRTQSTVARPGQPTGKRWCVPGRGNPRVRGRAAP